MAIGDLNKKFGWIWLLLGPLIGIYIGGQINSLGSAYTDMIKEITIAGQNVTMYMGEGPLRTPNRLLHVHSALLAFLNILYGINIDSVRLSDNTKKLGSLLAIAGAILVTIGFYLIQVISLSAFGFPLRVVGGISLLAAILIIIVGLFKK